MGKIELNSNDSIIYLDEQPVIHLYTFSEDKSLLYKGVIQAGVDLDTLTIAGIYHQTVDANAANGIHYPSVYAGVLEVVYEGTLVYQKYHVAGTNEAMYIRSKRDAVWSAWKQLAFV